MPTHDVSPSVKNVQIKKKKKEANYDTNSIILELPESSVSVKESPDRKKKIYSSS